LLLSAGGRYTDNNKYGGYSAYQGGIIVTPVKTTKIFANAAKGFNIPGIRYRFNLVGMPGLVNDINNDLEPETMTTYEAGVEQTLFEYLTLGATGYKIYSQNRILLDKAQKKWVNADYDINYKGVNSSHGSAIRILPVPVSRIHSLTTGILSAANRICWHLYPDIKQCLEYSERYIMCM